MSHFRHHVFFCTNQRDPSESCCNTHGARDIARYAKDYAKSLGLGDIRVSRSGCLGRCELGPTLVVYPEGVWYTYIDQEDIEEVIREHIKNGRIVERLRLSD